MVVIMMLMNNRIIHYEMIKNDTQVFNNEKPNLDINVIQ